MRKGKGFIATLKGDHKSARTMMGFDGKDFNASMAKFDKIYTGDRGIYTKVAKLLTTRGGIKLRFAYYVVGQGSYKAK